MNPTCKKLFITLALLATLVGCGGGSGSEPATATDSASVGGPGQTAAVTLAGAQGAQAVVPAGALAQAMTLRLAADSSGAPALPAGLTAAGPVISLSPHNALFSVPVRVRVPITQPLPAGQRALVAKVSPGGSWQLLEPVARADGHLEVEVSSNSFFVAVGFSLGTATGVVGTNISFRMLNPAGMSTGSTVQLSAPGDMAMAFTLGFAPACGAPEGWQVRALAEQLTVFASPSGASYIFGSPITLQSKPEGSEHVLRLPWSALQVINNYATPVPVAVAPPAANTTRQELFRVREFRAVCPAHGSVAEQLFPAGMPVQERMVSVATGNRLFFTRNPVATQAVVGDYPVFPVEVFAAQLGQPGSVIGVQLEMIGGGIVDTQDTLFRPDGKFALELRRVTLDDHGARMRAVASVIQGPGLGESAVSAEATLSVVAVAVPPSFSTLPQSVMVLRGQTASFIAVAAGLPTPALQWQTRPANSNGAWTDLPATQGGNSTTLTTSALALADNGTQYRVVASNAGGRNESPPVTVSVSDQAVAPAITADLSTVRALRGGDATFAVGVRGTEPLNYTWRVGGQVVAGQNAPVLNLQSVQADATVQVSISNAAGTAHSRTVDLRLFDGALPEAPVTILRQPVSQTINTGQTAVLAVHATGGGTLTYRWLYNGVEVIGFPNAPVLVLGSTHPGLSGNYRVEVSNAAGQVTSSAATLTVLPPTQPVPLGFAVQPVGLSLNPGQTATFAAVARGTGAIGYQWLREGVPIAGATQPVLSLPSVAVGDAGNYTVQVTDDSRTTLSSNPAALVLATAPGAPRFTAQTQSVQAQVGDTPRIAMTVTGAPAPQCLWLRNGTPIAGASDCSGLTLPAVTLADQGSVYTVIAYNAGGSAVGGPAVLTVAAAPQTGALTATQLVAGHEWSMVLRPDRTVWGWGGLHKLDGSVVVANLNPADQARRPAHMYPAALTDVRQIAGWYDSFWALKGDPGSAASRVLHWGNARSGSDGRGSDGAGNLGVLPSFRYNTTPLEVLERRSVNGSLQAAPVDRVCSIAGTSDRLMMIRALDAFGSPTDCNVGSAKTVWVAGTLTQYNTDAVGVAVPVLGLPGTPARLVAQQHSAQSSSGPMLVLLEDGRAFGWGTNIGNQFGLASSAGTGYVGGMAAPQALPGSWSSLADAAFSYVGLLGLRTDGTLHTSGRNDGGELGLGPQPSGTVTNGPLPVLASPGVPLDGVSHLASAHVQVSLALRQGRILVWGAAGQALQGGDAARIDHPRLLPASGDGWQAISAGHAHALALAANGTVYTWGSGLRGALGNGVDGGSALAPTLVMLP